MHSDDDSDSDYQPSDNDEMEDMEAGSKSKRNGACLTSEFPFCIKMPIPHV